MSQNVCRHIRPSGRRCQAPSVRNRALCYYHQALHEKHNGDIPAFLQTIATAPPQHLDPVHLGQNPIMQKYYGIRPGGPADIDLPPLEDRESIQIAISTVLNACAQNRIDHRRAGTLLYGLQMAIVNLRIPYRDEPPNPVLATDSILDEHGQLIAHASPELLAAPESESKTESESETCNSPIHHIPNHFPAEFEICAETER